MEKLKSIELEYIRDYRLKIGNSIRLYREQKEYSQDDLAEMMELNKTTISKIENGKFAINIDLLVKFGWYLDFEFVFLKK